MEADYLEKEKRLIDSYSSLRDTLNLRYQKAETGVKSKVGHRSLKTPTIKGEPYPKLSLFLSPQMHGESIRHGFIWIPPHHIPSSSTEPPYHWNHSMLVLDRWTFVDFDFYLQLFAGMMML